MVLKMGIITIKNYGNRYFPKKLKILTFKLRTKN